MSSLPPPRAVRTEAQDRPAGKRCRPGAGGPGGARPYLAEIGSGGGSPDKYNLYLGAAFDGSRLNKLYRQDVGHDEIVAALAPLIECYANERASGERFGDLVIRKGYVAPTTSGRDFHANFGPELAA
jgi:sulfite reductase (NADPH) hemoprotein beta-component